MSCITTLRCRLTPFRALIALVAIFGLSAAAVRAEILEATANGISIKVSTTIAADPRKVYAVLIQPQRWWNPEYTWSGDAKNLTLKAEAGGCLCERWTEGSAEHGRVLMALPGRLLRLTIALGPLQEFQTHSTIQFWLQDSQDGNTRLETEYQMITPSGYNRDDDDEKLDELIADINERLASASVSLLHARSASINQKPAVPHGSRYRELLQGWEKEAIETLNKSRAAEVVR